MELIERLVGDVTGMVWGLIGAAIGLVGIGLSIYFYRQSKRDKEPVWTGRTVTLISAGLARVPGLRVLLDERSVSELAVTKLLFFNRGFATIDRNDLVPTDPLRIQGDDATSILRAEIAACNNQPAEPMLELDPSGRAAKITFVYLDHDQGFVVEVLHTGGHGRDGPRIVGSIKGALAGSVRYVNIEATEPAVVSIINKSLSLVRRIPINPIGPVGILLSLVFTLVPLLLMVAPMVVIVYAVGTAAAWVTSGHFALLASFPRATKPWESAFIVIGAFVYSLLIFFIRLPRQNVPRGLGEFLDDVYQSRVSANDRAG